MFLLYKHAKGYTVKASKCHLVDLDGVYQSSEIAAKVTCVNTATS